MAAVTEEYFLRSALSPATGAMIEAEMRRRKIAENYKSMLLDPGSKYNGLMAQWYRYIVLYGGRDAAKSWTIAEWLVREMADHHERILCTREFQNSVKDSVHRLLRDMINRLGLSSRFDVTDREIRGPHNGEFIFKGLRHNVDEVKSTEGITKCWVEEAHNTSDDSWKTLIPTIRENGSTIIVSFNTPAEDAPTFQRFITNEAALRKALFDQFGVDAMLLQKVGYEDNIYLSDVSKAEIAYLKSVDQDAFDHIYGGYPKKHSDAVIFGGKWREEMFDDELWRKADKLMLGADFGFANDPNTLIRCFIIGKKLYIEYEAWGLKIELTQMYDWYLKHVPLADRWPIKADSARPETISMLRGKGLLMSAAKKWNGSVEDGIAHLRAYEEIIIHPRCKHTLDEARLYSYKVDKLTGDVLPLVVDKHNHCWDAIRYAHDGQITSGGILGIYERMGGKGR